MDPLWLSETIGAVSEKEEAETQGTNEEGSQTGKRAFDSETLRDPEKKQRVSSEDEAVQAMLSLSSFREKEGEGGSKSDIEPPQLPKIDLTIVKRNSTNKGVTKTYITVGSCSHTRTIRVPEHGVGIGTEIKVTKLKNYFEKGHRQCPKGLLRGLLNGDQGKVTGINYPEHTSPTFYVEFDNEQIEKDMKILYTTGRTLHHEITPEMLYEGEITNIQHAKMSRSDFEIIN